MNGSDYIEEEEKRGGKITMSLADYEEIIADKDRYNDVLLAKIGELNARIKELEESLAKSCEIWDGDAYLNMEKNES